MVVMTDDQTVEQMDALERVRAELGRGGTTFTNNFTTFPICCPSRATFLTGQYAHNHDVRGNRAPSGGFYKLDSTNTLPVWLRDAGYATAHIGKYLNGYGTRDPRQVPPGWDEWHGSVDPTPYNFFEYCLNENGRLVTYGQHVAVGSACPGAEPEDIPGRPLHAQGEELRRSSCAEYSAFFLSVAYLAPHSGGPPGRTRCQGSAKPAPRHRLDFADARLPRPPGFNEADVSDKPTFIRRLPRVGPQDIERIRTDYQCRREALLAVDEGVGAIVDALRAREELDETLFVFTSDNGFFQGEHRVPRSKLKVYEPSVRVPALMRGPGVPSDERVPQLTSNVDLAATIVDATGAEPGGTLDGVSLLDLAQRPSAFARREILLETGPEGGSANPQYSAVRTPRYKYVEYATGERELYDPRADPFEQRSVHRDPRYVVVRNRLAARLAVLRDCSGSTCQR